MKMNERKQRILEALILDYIATGDPVGSRTIAKKYDLGVSSATIRNEMADLEELGFLKQPYTSAGRIPSQLGYRYYVDCLMEKQPLPSSLKNYIRATLLERVSETETLIQVISQLLSQLTNYTALVSTPMFTKNRLEHIQLLPLGSNKFVLVVILDQGHVEHCTFELPFSLGETELRHVSFVLNKYLRGLSLGEWQDGVLHVIKHELARHEHFYQQLMKLIEKILAWEYNSKVYLGGTVNILEQPEFSDVKKVKSLLALLEEEKILQEVLASGSDVGITVKIGKEDYYEAMEHCSLITATYKLKGKVIGTFGVLGPTRMEYAKVISIVEFLTMVLTEKLCKVEGE